MSEKVYCPECGCEMVEWQGQIDETPTGSAIYGYSYDCPECGYETPVEELGEWADDEEGGYWR